MEPSQPEGHPDGHSGQCAMLHIGQPVTVSSGLHMIHSQYEPCSVLKVPHVWRCAELESAMPMEVFRSLSGIRLSSVHAVLQLAVAYG